MDEASDYDFGDGNVVIASYPITGKAWISYIILQILSYEKHLPEKDKKLKAEVECLQIMGETTIFEKPKVYQTYFLYDKIRKHPNTKFIYIYRRPEDTFASYYNFLLQQNESLDFERCFQDFILGNGIFDGFFDNVLSYSKHKGDNNLLLISYESIHTNTRDEILKIAKFLGEGYYNSIKEDEAALNRIIEQTNFDSTVKNQKEDYTSSEASSDESVHDPYFLKKGVIGNGKKLLNADQLNCLARLTIEKLEGTEVFTEWS